MGNISGTSMTLKASDAKLRKTAEQRGLFMTAGTLLLSLRERS